MVSSVKDKPLVIIITLLGGAVCSICCILKRAGLLWTLLATFITLLVFLIIGLIVNRFYTEVKNEVIAADKERERIAEEERLKREEENRLREEWEAEHPGVPYPEEEAAAEEATEETEATETL